MASVTVRIPRVLRDVTAGRAHLDVDVPDPASVGDLLDELARRHPALERRVRDERSVMRIHVNVFVGVDNIRDLDSAATRLRDGDEVTIIPAISGG